MPSPKKALAEQPLSRKRNEKLLPELSDFEKSPLRFEYEILLEEYRTTRAQIDSHMANQHQVINFSLAVLAAGVALSQFTVSNSTLIALPMKLLELIGSLIFSSFALMYLWHDTSVAFLAAFINHVLRPRLENIIVQASEVSRPILLWDEFQSRNRMRNFLVAPVEYGVSLGRYAITVLPSIGLLLTYLLTLDRHTRLPTMETFLLAAAILACVIVILASIYTPSLFIFNLPISAHKKWKQP